MGEEVGLIHAVVPGEHRAVCGAELATGGGTFRREDDLNCQGCNRIIKTRPGRFERGYLRWADERRFAQPAAAEERGGG